MKKSDKIFTIIFIVILGIMFSLMVAWEIYAYYRMSDLMEAKQSTSPLLNKYSNKGWQLRMLIQGSIYCGLAALPLALGIFSFRYHDVSGLKIIFYIFSVLYFFIFCFIAWAVIYVLKAGIL
ncbi:MAG: hypothetical protein ACJ77K_08490 [Bacteroidia bacterium]|jgi:hypothetical protein